MDKIKKQDLFDQDDCSNQPGEHRTFYTLEEISQMLKVPTRTVKRFISTGKLKAIRVGYKSLRIEKSQYETFLDQFYNWIAVIIRKTLKWRALKDSFQLGE